MLIKMDSEVFVAASFVWVGLIVSHHKTSDTLRLALYQLINVNWQNYEQEIMPHSQITTQNVVWEHFSKFIRHYKS